jgi:hypothetical protein
LAASVVNFAHDLQTRAIAAVLNHAFRSLGGSCLRSKTTCAALALALVTVAGPASARPDTRTMTCAQAQTYVKQNNAIVMTTGQNTYTRIVSGQGSCSQSQTTRRLSAPTVDNPKCQVGFECRERQFD